MRIRLLLLVLLTFTMPLHAGEWKEQPYQDSIIELHTDWPWTAPERGKYKTKWRDDFSVQDHTAKWFLGATPRIEIGVERLAPNYGYWTGVTEENYRLDEDFLTWWNDLNKWGVSDIAPLQCDARECVTFTASGIYRCAAFVTWSGQLNDRNDTDLISGYYCAGENTVITTEQLNQIFASIAIRGVSGSYVKRATMANIIEQSQEEAVDDLSSRTEQGDAEVQYKLGQSYQNGIGQQKDIVEALNWYLRAAVNGHPAAQYEIGFFYEKGRSVSKDLNEALKWYRKAAEQENPRAQHKVGLFYEQGWAVPSDLDEALNWYRRAAEQGHALAGMALSRLETTATVLEPALLPGKPEATSEVSASTPQSDSSVLVEQETAFWQSIQDSSDPLMFEAYLRRYPKGVFVDIARLKRDALSSPQSALQTPSTGTKLLNIEEEPSINIIKKIIIDFYNNNEIKHEAKPDWESTSWFVTTMVSIHKITVNQTSNKLITANLFYQWEINEFTYFSKSSRGLATIDITGEPKVIKFETGGYTFLPINQPSSYYK